MGNTDTERRGRIRKGETGSSWDKCTCRRDTDKGRRQVPAVSHSAGPERWGHRELGPFRPHRQSPRNSRS